MVVLTENLKTSLGADAVIMAAGSELLEQAGSAGLLLSVLLIPHTSLAIFVYVQESLV